MHPLGLVQYLMVDAPDPASQHTLPPPYAVQSLAVMHSRKRLPFGHCAVSRHSHGPEHPGIAQQTAMPPDWLQFASFTQIEPTGCPVAPPCALPPLDVMPPLDVAPPADAPPLDVEPPSEVEPPLAFLPPPDVVAPPVPRPRPPAPVAPPLPCCEPPLPLPLSVPPAAPTDNKPPVPLSPCAVLPASSLPHPSATPAKLSAMTHERGRGAPKTLGNRSIEDRLLLAIVHLR